MRRENESPSSRHLFTAAEVHYCLLRPARTALRLPGPVADEEEEPDAADAGSLEGIGAAEKEGSRAAAAVAAAAASAAAAAAAVEQNRLLHKPHCWRSASERCKAPDSARQRPWAGRCPSQRLCFG